MSTQSIGPDHQAQAAVASATTFHSIVHEGLIQITRTDVHAFAKKAEEEGGITVHAHERPSLPPMSHDVVDQQLTTILNYLNQLLNSFLNDAKADELRRSTPSLIPSTHLSYLFQYYHLLFQHCHELLDYAQYLDTLISTSSNPLASIAADSTLANEFHQSKLSSLLHSSLPWLVQCLQQQLDSPNTGCCSIEIGNLVQSSLSLLCRCAHAESTAKLSHATASSPTHESSTFIIPPTFRGLSLRQMLNLLRDSHQFTTTVYRTNTTTTPGSGKLQNTLVPFAQKVLTGLFVEFAVGSRTKVKSLDAVTMNQAEFVRFYSLSHLSLTPIEPLRSLQTTANVAVAPLHHLPPIAIPPPTSSQPSVIAAPTPVVSVTNVTPPITPGSSQSPWNLNPTPPAVSPSLQLPAAPTIHRSHTAISSSSPSLPLAPLMEPISLQFLPSSVSQLQASAEFRKAVIVSTIRQEAPNAPVIDLNGWLKWNLDGFVENARGKLSDLTLVSEGYDWKRSQQQFELELSQANQHQTMLQAIQWSELVRQMQEMYDLLLHQVFPAPPTTPHHSSDSDEPPKRSVDDLDLKAFSASPPSIIAPLTTDSTTNRTTTSVIPTEFIPKLMESEANWTHHSNHAALLQFLEKFIQGNPVTNATHQTTSLNINKIKSPNPLNSPISQPMPTTPIAIYSIPSILSSPSAARLKTESKTQEMDTKQRSAADDEKTTASLQYARIIAQSLRPAHSPPLPEYPIIARPPLSAHGDTPLTVSEGSSPIESRTIAAADASTTSSEFPGGELEEPARCLSSLFIRCLSEMGGGSAKKKIESWSEAVRAEKAYAAACIKHNGLTDEVFQYSSSVAAVELLRLSRLSVNPRTGLPSLRILSHVTCPQWLKSIVSSTFQDIRSPLLTILRNIEDEEANLEELQQAQAGQPAQSRSTGDASPVVALRKSQATIRKLQRQSRALVHRVLVNSTFLVKDLDDIQKDIHAKVIQTQLSQQAKEVMDEKTIRPLGYSAAHIANLTGSLQKDNENNSTEANETSGQLSASTNISDKFHEGFGGSTMPARYRSLASKSALPMTTTLPPHLVASPVFNDASTQLYPNSSSTTSTSHASTHMHPSASSKVLSKGDQSNDSQFSVNVIPPPPQRQLSDVIRRRRHSVLTVSPPESNEFKLDFNREHSPTDEAADIAEVAQATSITNYLSGSPSHYTNGDDDNLESIHPSSLWSSWSTSISRQQTRAPYDSKWLFKLIQCGNAYAIEPGRPYSSTASHLRDLLQPSIHRFQTVCLLRLKLLSWMNLCFRSGYAAAVVDQIFPLLLTHMTKYKARHEAHLLHYGQLILKGKNTKNVLLHFYKHLVSTMNEQLPSTQPSPPTSPVIDSTQIAPIDYADLGWTRIRNCLELLRLDFLSEDTECLVGSGVFASLFRTIQQIDQDIQQVSRRTRMTTPHHRTISSFQLGSPISLPRQTSDSNDQAVDSSVSSALPSTLRCSSAYHLKFLCWQTLKSLTLFVLSQQQQELNSMLLSSVARQFVQMMINQLEVMTTTPARLPLQHEDGSLMYTLDSARILLHFTRMKSICTIGQLQQLVQLSSTAPASIQTVVVQLITYELMRVSPLDLDQVRSGNAEASTKMTSVSIELIQNWIDRIGQRLITNTVLSSLLQPYAASIRTISKATPTTTPISTATELPSFGLPSSAMSPLLTHQRSLSTSPAHRRQQSDDTRPPFWHESGYQTWRTYPHILANNHCEITLCEEMIIALRHLLFDRKWRATIVKILSQHIATIPKSMKELEALPESNTTHSLDPTAYVSSIQAHLASLAVLGGCPFQLRPNALVEVLLAGRRSMRGVVLAIDTHECKILVRLSPSQPQAVIKPYSRPSSNTTSSLNSTDFQLAPLIEQEFSFDQVRVLQPIAAPFLSDFPSSTELWSAIRQSMEHICFLTKSESAPSLITLFSLQMQKYFVCLLQAQLSISLSRLRSKTAVVMSTDAVVPTAFSTHCSPILSPNPDPIHSPISPGFNLEPPHFDFNSASPAVSPPASSSPDVLSSPEIPVTSSPSETITLAPIRTGGSPTIATAFTPPARGRTVSATKRGLSIALQSTLAVPSTSKHPSLEIQTGASVDFISFLPLLLSITKDFQHQLISLSMYELEQSSGLFSRRLYEVLRAEQKHSLLWNASGGCQPKAIHSRRGSSFQSGSDRVAFIPFDKCDIESSSSSSKSYRCSLVAALQAYFFEHRQLASMKSPDQLLPRLLIFPLLTIPPIPPDQYPSTHATVVPEETGIIVVQMPTIVPVKKDAPESKENAASQAAANDPTVPRLLNLSDMGLSEDLAHSILPISPVNGGATDSDEAETEAIEMVLGEGCTPEHWSVDRWMNELNHTESIGTEATINPKRGEMTITARRVIIGPSGQAAVLTSATPATSRANTPRNSLQVPGSRRSRSNSLTQLPPTGQTVGAGSSSSATQASAGAAPPPSLPHLHAKYCRTTTHEERTSLLNHIAAISKNQVQDPRRLQLYDWVDARDSYGDWYLGQVLGWRGGTPHNQQVEYFIHFFAWDDMYREWISVGQATPPGEPSKPTDRLRLASLFNESRDRLESDRFIRKVKIYGSAVLDAMKIERELQRLNLARDQAKQVASIAMSDAYSYPLVTSTYSTASGTISQKVDASLLNVGTQVLVTAAAVELLSIQLGRGLLEIATEYFIGDRLMVLDTVNKLCEGEVIECRMASTPSSFNQATAASTAATISMPTTTYYGEIKIHYVGWASKWDEWIPVNSSRIQSKRGGLSQCMRHRRHQQLNTWNGAGGHAAQLIGLVGQNAIITKLARASSTSRSDVTSDLTKFSDTLAQVQLLDPEYGSLVCFWTRLQLLRRMEEVDVVHINLPGLLQLNSQQISTELAHNEKRVLGLWTSKLIRALIKSMTKNEISIQSNPVVPSPTGVLSPTPLLRSSSMSNTLLSPSFASSSLSLLPTIRLTNAAQFDSFISSFRSILSSLPRVSQTVIGSHAKCPGGIPDPFTSPHHMAETSWVVHPHHRTPLRLEDIEAADREARMKHVYVATDPEKKEVESKEADNKNNSNSPPASDPLLQAAWLNEHQERNLNHLQLEKLSIITSLVALILHSPASSSQSVLTHDRCNFLHTESRKLSHALLDEFHTLSKRHSPGQTPLTGSLSSGIQTIRPGQVVKLIVDQSGINALVVGWTRSSQPNFEVQFMVSPESALNQSTTGKSSSSASAWAPSPSPPPSSLTLVDHSTPAVVSLVNLKHIPLLRTGASPLILPNPVYLVASLSNDAKKSPPSEDEAEAADDDFSIVVTPYTNRSLESFLTFAEVMVHLRRECRARPELVTPSVRMELDYLLIHLVRSFIDFVSLFQSVCSWPCSQFKGAVFEAIGHLLIELSRSLSESLDQHEEPTQLVASLRALPTTWSHPFIAEARDRYEAEKENWPLFSSYLQRLMEMLVTAVQYERMVERSLRLFPGLATSTLPAKHLHQPTPRHAHAPSFASHSLDVTHEDDDSDSGLSDQFYSPSPDSTTSSLSCSSAASIYHTPPPPMTDSTRDESHLMTHGHTDVSLYHTGGGQGEDQNLEGVTAFLEQALPIVLQMDDLLVKNHHLFLRSSSLSPTSGPKCMCQECQIWRGEMPGLDQVLMLLDFSSSIWPLLLGGPMRLLPARARERLFDEFINVTATPERWLPEFSFTTRNERTLTKDAAPTAAAAIEDEDTDSTWEQLVKNLRVTPASHLRGKLSDVIWKARFKGLTNKGAEGLPGPFRQSLTEVCDNLRNTSDTSKKSILCPAPNFFFDTGLDRNKFLLRPTASLDESYAFGQLLGVAIRSQGVLDIDMSPLIWRALLGEELSIADLAMCDYTAYKSLKFENDSGQPLTKEEFDEHYSELTWTTRLSDGTHVELIHHGASRSVRFEERFLYAKSVLKQRLDENRLVLNHLRAGLSSIIPIRTLSLLTWHEFELRSCGSPTLDLSLLARHTVYAPKTFTADSPIIRWFWRVLAECTEEERAKFMQFAWARSRLPPESGREQSWRMKLNILESSGPNDLPTAETCFFNLNLPNYHDYETLQSKLLLAITHCSSINS